MKKIKKVFNDLFIKKSIAFRKGYIHFYHGKSPNIIKDNPYKPTTHEFREWKEGFRKSIDDVIAKTEVYQRPKKLD